MLAGDASDRTYYRLAADDTKSYVLMQLGKKDAGHLKDNKYEWLLIRDLLETRGVLVPEVIKIIPSLGVLVISDYGNTMFEDAIALTKDNPVQQEKLYTKAFAIISDFLDIEPSSNQLWCQRAFDAERLNWEMQFYKKYFLQKYCGYTFNKERDEKFTKHAELLCNALCTTSHSFVHRDLHSRNLMVYNQKIAVIDFQDARLGNPAYDLVSLCFDPYVELSWEFRNKLFEQGAALLKSHNGSKTYATLEKTWKQVFIQRQLKVLGSFAYLKIEKNKPQYEAYIPKVIEMLAHFSIENLLPSEAIKQI